MPTSRSTPSSNENVSEMVVSAIAEAEGTTPDAVNPPLYDVVDPDALDDIFAPRAGTGETTVGHVQFVYGQYEITVSNDGVVTLEEEDEQS